MSSGPLMFVKKLYRCFIQSSAVSNVLTFGMTCWGGNAFKPDHKNRLDKTTRSHRGGLVGRRQERYSLSSTDDKNLRTILAENTN